MKPLPSLTRRVAQLAVAGLGVGGGRAGLIFSLSLRSASRADGRMAVVARWPHAFALFQVVLQQVAAVVHGLGGLDLEVGAVRELVDFAEDLLELLAARAGRRAGRGPREPGRRRST